MQLHLKFSHLQLASLLLSLFLELELPRYMLCGVAGGGRARIAKSCGRSEDGKTNPERVDSPVDRGFVDFGVC